MRFLALLAVLLGCNRESATTSSDPLWALVPAGARGGIVISPRGVAQIEAGYQQLRDTFDKVPDFAPAKAWLAEQLAPVGGPNLRLADFGFGAGRGAALFIHDDGLVAILPVIDRDKFLAKVKGTKGDPDKIVDTSCKLVRGFYACASNAALLETLGQGVLKKHLSHRGDVELVMAELLPFANAPVNVSTAITFARGAGTLRSTIINAPPEIADRFTKTATAKVDTQRTAGFTLIDLAAWLPKTEESLVGDVTIARALATLDGHMSVTTPAGVTVMNVEQGLADLAPMKTVVERCNELPGAELIEAKVDGGVCRFKAPNWDIALDLWLDGQKLRIGKKDNAPPPKTIPMSPFGAELARGTWSLAFWGRGTMLAGPELQGVQVPDELPTESAMVIRVMSLLNEIGFGARRTGNKLEIVAHVRTLFANPDPVLAKLFAITGKDIAATKSAALAEPIAKSAPSAPFARDFAAGHAGLLVPTALVGVGISIIVPAFTNAREISAPDDDLPVPAHGAAPIEQ